MNCDKLASTLPLLVLREPGDFQDDEARDHLRTCERCRARLTELERTRGALDLVAVADLPPLSGAQIRLAASRARPTTSVWRRAAAAAALALLSTGAGFVGGRFAPTSLASASLASDAASGTESEAAVPPDATPFPSAVVQALASFDERLAALELRHERDLVALAQAVDRQQLRCDAGVTRRLDSLAQATRAELAFTRGALDDVARLVQPAIFVPADDRH